jgi:hypothetical protein
MFEPFNLDEAVHVLQKTNDCARSTVQNRLPNERFRGLVPDHMRHLAREQATIANVTDDTGGRGNNIFLLEQVVVFCSMSWRTMDKARTRVRRYVSGRD